MNPPPEPAVQQEKVIEKITLPRKEKHPGRVAAGKRLAEWNRQKKQEKLTQQSLEPGLHGNPPEPNTPSTFDKCYLFLGIVGVTLTAIGLYYARRSMHVCPPTKVHVETRKESRKEPSTSKAVYEME